MLRGRFLDAYEFAVRTHVTRTIADSDVHLAQLYPKLTILAMSNDFNAVTARDILYTKQLQEEGSTTEEDIFQRTSEIGKKLGEKYLYQKNSHLRPSDEQYELAKNKLRTKQINEGDI
jgi:hypothetical protein